MIRTLPVLILLLAIVPAASASDDQGRLAYLESRLDASRHAIDLWQDGWTAVYTAAAVGYTALAIDTDNHDRRTLRVLGATRAAMAATLLTLRPHPGREGADPVRALPAPTGAERVAAAERILQDSANRTESKRRPGRHLRNILVNAGFGALVWVLGDSSDALPFTLLGIAGGEALLLTMPEQPRRDLADYRRRIGAAPASKRSWSVVPVPGGIRVQIALTR